MMRPYFIGLQFLTRLHFVRQTEWTAEDFGRSVEFFPLIGATLGLCYAVAAYFLAVFLPQAGLQFPPHLLGAVMVILPIVLTGGLHCDGFMDTADGLFSGRDREKMLAIMKDSRVGSNGVFAFVALVLFEFALALDLIAVGGLHFVEAFFLLPVIGRTMMTFAIVLYPYARPEGIGKAFKDYSSYRTLFTAFLLAAVFILPFGVPALVSLAAASVFTHCFSKFAVRTVGGLTGDIYGAVSTVSEAMTLLVYLIFGCWL